MSSNSDLGRSLRTEVGSALKNTILGDAKHDDYSFPLPAQSQSSGPNQTGADVRNATI